MTLRCPSCGSEHTRPYFSDNDWNLIECRNCRLVFLDAMPDRDKLTQLYEDQYIGATEGYFKKVDKKLKRARRRVQQIIRQSPGAPQATRLLDIGCNGGFLVEQARRAGFDVIGIDPDAGAIGFARRHFPDCTFVNAFLRDFDLEGRAFDAVYCSEVVEHDPDPNGFAELLAATLAPGGLLYLTTPDIRHWRRPRALEKWDGYDPPYHCLYFSPPSLKHLLERHGFTDFRFRPAFKPGIKLFARKA